MSLEERTPTPWEALDDGTGMWRVVGSNGELVALTRERPEEDAAYIVKAVNNHEPLIEALEEIAGDSLAASDPTLVIDAMRITARAAIEAAS